MNNPKEQFKKETGKSWVSNRTQYMEWLESKVSLMDLNGEVLHGKNCLKMDTACKQCMNKFDAYLKNMNAHIMDGSV